MLVLPLVLMLSRSIVVYGALLLASLAFIALHRALRRWRIRRILRSLPNEVRVADRVLTQFGFEATVVAVDEQFAELRIGTASEEQTIATERQAIIGKTAESPR